MPIGIRPTNDFAFKKTFGSPENHEVLISLLNAILRLSPPISHVTIVNPYNQRDFEEDKLSILDIKAVDQDGAIYNIEMQLSTATGLVKRMVFYGCEVYAGQLMDGDDYTKFRPVFAICLFDGALWSDSRKVHHAFRFCDRDSGRATPEIGNKLRLTRLREVASLRGLRTFHVPESGRVELQGCTPLSLRLSDCSAYSCRVSTPRPCASNRSSSARWQRCGTIRQRGVRRPPVSARSATLASGQPRAKMPEAAV